MHRAALLSLILFVLPASANELGQGIHVRQVAMPVEPVKAKTFAVGKVEGSYAGKLGELVAAELADETRKVPGETQGLARAAGNAGATAAAMAASALTFGLAAGAAYKAVDDANEKKLEANIRKIEDGLTIMPYKVVTSGADATFTAKVTGDFNDNSYTSKETRSSNGVSYEATVLCVKREVSVTLEWAWVDKSGKAIVSKTEDLSTARNACDEQVKNLPSAKQIATAAVESVAPRIAYTTLPSWKDLRIDLDSHKDLKDAIKDVKAGELQAALCKAHAAAEADPKNHVAFYDQGALLEALGHLDDAVESYEAVEKLKKHKGASKGKERAKSRKDEIALLESTYGMKYTVGKVDWGTCAG